MKIILNQKIIGDVLEQLKIKYAIAGEKRIDGYVLVSESNGAFYLREDSTHANEEITIVELLEEDVWRLDKFQTPIDFIKKNIVWEDETYLAYYKRVQEKPLEKHMDIKRLIETSDFNLSMNESDVYLMISGKQIKKREYSKYACDEKEIFHTLKKFLDDVLKDEYVSETNDILSRFNLGRVEIEIEKDLTDEKNYRQEAVMGVVRHDKTGFCILEIMVLNCAIGGNKLLNYYCGEQLTFHFDNQKFTLDNLLAYLDIQSFGKKRSIVFGYGDITKTEIINALANEEFPMAEIGGDLEQKVSCENIAQYNTAEVYVSSQTMFEKCKKMEVCVDKRLHYHALEIFFVELVLFKDAAIDKVYYDLEKEQNRQKDGSSVQDSTEALEQIEVDMAQALNFVQFDAFRFLTVRLSAKNIAENFGMKEVMEKYHTNKEFLEAMISANRRREEKRQNKIKNFFLMILSAMTTIGTLGEILYAMYVDAFGAVACYFFACILVLLTYVLYKFLDLRKG